MSREAVLIMNMVISKMFQHSRAKLNFNRCFLWLVLFINESNGNDIQ